MSRYPGLGLPLRHNPQGDHDFYPLGAHGSCWGSQSDILPVRELAMMSIMERLTDKEDWHKKVFDADIVSKWCQEALSIPDAELWHLSASGKIQSFDYNTGELTLKDDKLEPVEGIMTKETFDCCIQELRSKAKYYEQTGIIPTLDACATMAKSDKLVSPALHEALRNAFDRLKTDQASSSSTDWHPNSNDMVQDLVHPSMYPLVYGRSRVLKDEVVGVEDAIRKWAGKGEVVPKEERESEEDTYRYCVGGDIPPQFWSETYQWLPANVAIQFDGTAKLTSYINNLHPTKYADIYRTIERLIETSLPMWDQCLALASAYGERTGAGRLESRFPNPEDPDDDNTENWIPSDPRELAHIKVDWKQINTRGLRSEPPTEEDPDDTQAKWELLRKPRIPEPRFTEVEYTPEPGKRLVDRYTTSGLQIIVKMASIELTPEKPEFPAGGWHVEGLMNEHICATALYYLDSENITSSSLSFRMQTDSYLSSSDQYPVGQDNYSWMEYIYGTSFGYGAACLQNYGTVNTCEGRLLAFPNVFQHRVSPFRLIDPTKPGHRRFIALWLVDPSTRIISTANVPPQQESWWTEAVFGSDPESRSSSLSKLPGELVTLLQEKGIDLDADLGQGHLPPELMGLVRDHFKAGTDTLPMTLEEANEHRLKLMQERSTHHRTAEKWWQQHSYSFCEH